MTTWGIVVAAGSGTRFGGAKQYEQLGAQRVLDWAVQALRPFCDGVVLVVSEGHAARHEPGVDAVVTGGSTRSESVRAGLAAVPAEADIVVVHDAVRPLASPHLFEAVVGAVVAGADGAVPGVPVSDTVKRVGEGCLVIETLDRSQLVAVQTPQAFRTRTLRGAHGVGADTTDDAALVESAGGRVVVVPGDPANIKLTAPHDLVVAEALLATK